LDYKPFHLAFSRLLCTSAAGRNNPPSSSTPHTSDCWSQSYNSTHIPLDIGSSSGQPKRLPKTGHESHSVGRIAHSRRRQANTSSTSSSTVQEHRVDELIKAFHKILQPNTPSTPASTAHDQSVVERCKSLAKNVQKNTPSTRPSTSEQEKKMDQLSKAFRTIFDSVAPEERGQSSQHSVTTTGTGTWKRHKTPCVKTKSQCIPLKPPVSYFLPLPGPLEPIWIRPPPHPPMMTDNDELSSSDKENEQECDRVEKELNDRLAKLSLNVLL